MVKLGDTLYGIHERTFHAYGKQYRITHETVTRVFSDKSVATEYYIGGFKRNGFYLPQDFGKHIFTDKEEAGRKRHELSVLRKADED